MTGSVPWSFDPRLPESSEVSLARHDGGALVTLNRPDEPAAWMQRRRPRFTGRVSEAWDRWTGHR